MVPGRLVVLILLALTSVCEADSLDCAAPPPLGALPANTGLTGQGSQAFSGGDSQPFTFCTEDKPGLRISTSAVIDRLNCGVTDVISINNYQPYYCPLNSSCSGVGTFTSPKRMPSSVAGYDIICITFSNATNYSGATSLRIRLKPPAAELKSINDK